MLAFCLEKSLSCSFSPLCGKPVSLFNIFNWTLILGFLNSIRGEQGEEVLFCLCQLCLAANTQRIDLLYEDQQVLIVVICIGRIKIMAPETGKLVKMDMRSVDRMEITKKKTAAPGEMWKGQIEGAALLRRPARQIFNFLSLIDPLQRQQDKQQ